VRIAIIASARLMPFTLLVSCALVAGCGRWIEHQAIAASISVISRSKAAMQQESDIELARAATPSGIKTLEGLHVAYPGERALVALLAEAVCQYGAGFLQDDWEEATLAGDRDRARAARQSARRILARCVNHGLELLGPAWAKALWSGDAGFDALVARAGRDQVAGMFWLALGLGSTIGMYAEDIALGAHLPRVMQLLHRVIELDERFQDGLAHMTLGIIYSARSAAVGGDPARGARHFERARALTRGKSLMVEVMYARHYAVITRDRALFRNTLITTLRTAPAIWPENRLANELAHRKARRYLTRESAWF
jgi:hypothetical protein